MGYYTKYKIEIRPENYPAEILEEQVHSETLQIQDFMEVAGGIKLYFDTTWYTHKEELTEISKKYPDCLFIVDGVGEDCEDVWKLYVKNGKSVRYNATISFPESDEGDLQNV